MEREELEGDIWDRRKSYRLNSDRPQSDRYERVKCRGRVTDGIVACRCRCRCKEITDELNGRRRE